MSWVQEEWKTGLSNNVLAKISELEDTLEHLTKERKCIQFQSENLQAALDKSKAGEDVLKKHNQETEKSLANAVTELEETTIQLEKIRAIAKEKDIIILNLTNEVANAKKERDLEKAERQRLERSCEKLEKELCEKSLQLDTLNKQLKEIEEVSPALVKQHELAQDDLEACRVESTRLTEMVAKLGEERDLERSERMQLQLDVDSLYENGRSVIIDGLKEDLRVKCLEIEELQEGFDELRFALETQRSNNAFLQEQIETTGESHFELDLNINYEGLESKIATLERENEKLHETIEAENVKSQAVADTYDAKMEEQKKTVELLEKRIATLSKERDAASERLQEERELFLEAEATMKNEIQSIKKEGQEEREMYMELERELRDEIKTLKNQMEEFRSKEESLCTDSKLTQFKSLEYDNESLKETVQELEEKIDWLLKEKSELAEHNEHLANEISKEKEQRSDVEETMMGDIDSIQSSLQKKINELKHVNKELVAKNKDLEESADELQHQIEELCQELDEVNKLLNAEREQSMKLANEVDDMRKQEEYRIKFASIESKDSHLQEKSSLATLTKKRSERWNVEVYELKKKIEELEKKNRELSSSIDKKNTSVLTLRQGFENKLKEDPVSRSGGRKAITDPRTPDRSELSDTRQRSGYNTPISKSCTSIQSINDENNKTSWLSKKKDQMIEKLKQEIFEVRNEKDKDTKTYKATVNALEQELAVMKQNIMEKEQLIQSFSAHVDASPCKTNLTPMKKGEKKKMMLKNSANDSGVDIQDIKSNKMKLNSIADLRNLVIEFEKESSELQEIIDESKDAIFELTKALQADQEVYLVDSKNNAIDNCQERIVHNERDEMDNLRCNQKRPGQQAEEKSYVLTRLSQSDIDVTSVLSKLRIAVSQLESRLDRVQAEKQQTVAKIEKIRTTKGEYKEKKEKQPMMMQNTHEESIELPLESPVGRSAVIDIARKRDATILDGTIDEIAHEENRKQKEENVFQHSSRCRLLWQQLCDAQSSLSSYEREINRQKMNYHKNLMECKEKVQQAEQMERGIAEAGRMANEQYVKQEYVINDLEEKLLIEKNSSAMLMQKLEGTQNQLEEAKGHNSTFNDKLEETRLLLYKHHKSSEKKLEALMNFLKEDMVGQFKVLIDNELKASSATKRKSSEYNRTNSCNNSFYSPEANIEAELTSKRSRGRRGRGIEEQAYRTAAHGYNTIDELDTLKSRLSGVQDNVKSLVTSVDQAQREKSKLQEERARLLDRLHLKDEELKKLDSRLGDEKQKVKEHEEEYRAELDALKSEQFEVYKEFRDMCDKLKRKDIELLNKTKQIKLLTAEWKEKESKLSTQVDNLQNENQMLWAENGELRVELERSKSNSGDFVRKMKAAETELGQLYKKLSFVDNILHECRQKGLYQ